MYTASGLLFQPSVVNNGLCLCLIYAGLVRAQNGDGGGAQGLEAGDVGSDASDGGPNASTAGTDSGTVHLSRGATIAIAVVASIVVILGATSAVLFYLAKKRQWQIKDGVRKSARKVTDAVRAVATPLTPKKMTFSPVDRKKYQAESAKALKKANKRRQAQTDHEQKMALVDRPTPTPHRDIEKGLPDPGRRAESADGVDESTKGPSQACSKPRPPRVSIPTSAFKPDVPETPMWQKFFGR